MSKPFIWDALPTGSRNAVAAADLITILGVKTRQELSREVIREHRAGYPICSNGRGYFKPQDDSELQRYIFSRRRRARNTAAGTAKLIQILEHRQKPTAGGEQQ